jgi:ABC-type Na+ efflux pump permease subunit
MLINEEFFENFPTFLKSLTSNQREQIINIINIINELKKKGKMYNKIIKKIIENIIHLVESKLLKMQNKTDNCIENDNKKETDVINYDKIDKIVSKNKKISLDLDTYKENVEVLIKSLHKLDKSFKNYIIKTATEEFINTDGNILLIIPNIINHLNKLFE